MLSSFFICQYLLMYMYVGHYFSFLYVTSWLKKTQLGDRWCFIKATHFTVFLFSLCYLQSVTNDLAVIGNYFVATFETEKTSGTWP